MDRLKVLLLISVIFIGAVMLRSEDNGAQPRPAVKSAMTLVGTVKFVHDDSGTQKDELKIVTEGDEYLVEDNMMIKELMIFNGRKVQVTGELKKVIKVTKYQVQSDNNTSLTPEPTPSEDAPVSPMPDNPDNSTDGSGSGS
ncbi:MAG: hypothetical protein PHW04_02145 [Candidatus Wallbacteria bacterium]|nr:hypothetical protein [Candidatus Wallbacteria bacterium]